MHAKHTRYDFEDRRFERCRNTGPYVPNGRMISIANDLRQYEVQSHQKWMPGVVPNVDHPAKIGDMLTPCDFVREYMVDANTVFVSGIRSFRRYRSDDHRGVRQVELLGMPCRWFPIGVFEEYRHWDHVNRFRNKTDGLRSSETMFDLGA